MPFDSLPASLPTRCPQRLYIVPSPVRLSCATDAMPVSDVPYVSSIDTSDMSAVTVCPSLKVRVTSSPSKVISVTVPSAVSPATVTVCVVSAWATTQHATSNDDRKCFVLVMVMMFGSKDKHFLSDGHIVYCFYSYICVMGQKGAEVRSRLSVNVGGRLMTFDHARIMGILNCTPDSFYPASRSEGERETAERAAAIVREGGDIIDVGAFSTRPGACPVTEEEEMRRLRIALSAVRSSVPEAVVSVDTFRPDVARMAVEEYGVAMVNDVSGGDGRGSFGGAAPRGGDVDGAPRPMFDMIARLRVPYVLMSSRGTLGEIMREFAASVSRLRALGVTDIILDPGFGFGKTTEQNYAVLGGMDILNELELPVLVGLSRKSMVCAATGVAPEGALAGTIALCATALAWGASILRVHDVREAVECVRACEKIDG